MISRKWTATAALAAVLVGLALFGTFRAWAYPDEQQDENNRDKQKPQLTKKTTKADNKQTTRVANPPLANQETAFPRRAEEQAIRKTIADYCAAFNKGDVNALTELWTHDAEYINEEGKTFRGRDAIRRLMTTSVEDHKGSKLSIKVGTIRFIKPDVAQEQGTAIMTSEEGTVEPGRYCALWVKKDGKWRLNTVRDLSELAQADTPAAYNKLKPLAWLVGEWHEKSSKGDVTLTGRWSTNQTFLLLDFTIKRSDGTQTTARERIGWDPYGKRLRSWLFDSSGGFGEGYWTRQGNSWQIESEGVLPDGRLLTAVHTWKYVDENTAEWSSSDRQADEVPLPDLHVTFVRTTKGR